MSNHFTKCISFRQIIKRIAAGTVIYPREKDLISIIGREATSVGKSAPEAMRAVNNLQPRNLRQGIEMLVAAKDVDVVYCSWESVCPLPGAH